MDALLAWIGGKRLLRKIIIPMIPEGIKGYIEPFAGAGWVFFAKDKWAALEVLNDADGELINLYRTVKFHIDALVQEMAYMASSREFFYQLKENRGLTEIQRAARFLYLVKRSFGAKGETFGVGRCGGGAGFTSHFNILLTAERLHERMDRVVIENRDFEDVLKGYDAPENFFYMDPPYFQGSSYYRRVGKFDHSRLAAMLPALKGKWLLSIDDCAPAREMFGKWTVKEVDRQNGIERKNIKNQMFKELLIRNY